MVIFINDILVATDTEEGHNELVEEVLKRLKKRFVLKKKKVYVLSREEQKEVQVFVEN